MERVENDQKSQFFYAFAANPGFIEIPNYIGLLINDQHHFIISQFLCLDLYEI